MAVFFFRESVWAAVLLCWPAALARYRPAALCLMAVIEESRQANILQDKGAILDANGGRFLFIASGERVPLTDLAASDRSFLFFFEHNH
jgi:hypothetical protein